MVFFSPFDNSDRKIYISDQNLFKYTNSLALNLALNSAQDIISTTSAKSTTSIISTNLSNIIKSPDSGFVTLNGSIVLDDLDSETLILMAKCINMDFHIDAIRTELLIRKSTKEYNKRFETQYYIVSTEDIQKNKYIKLRCDIQTNILMDKLVKSIRKYLSIEDVAFKIYEINNVDFKYGLPTYGLSFKKSDNTFSGLFNYRMKYIKKSIVESSDVIELYNSIKTEIDDKLYFVLSNCIFIDC